MEKGLGTTNATNFENARRRKSSAHEIALERAKQEHIDLLDDSELIDEADRRLAELGYVQVHAIDFSVLISELY
jgi:hypothetical protein